MPGGKRLQFLEGVKRPWKFLAPMVSNSEEAYRLLARRYGADLCFTEMIHCQSYNNSKSSPENNVWFTTSREDRPLIVQICGNDPDIMLLTCLSVEGHCDGIDINFGCPQEIARRGRYGAFLMDDWELIEKIVRRLSSALSVPVFCKIRIFESIDRTVEFARMIERAGCSLLTVHGRLRSQRGAASGLASWDHVKMVKAALNIPVIANGNMIYSEDIDRCIAYTHCDGVMIAEPHLYDPTIFASVQRYSIDLFDEYLSIVSENPTRAKFKHIKSHCFKIMRHFLELHREYNEIFDKCSSMDEFLAVIENIRSLVAAGLIPSDDLKLAPYIRRGLLEDIVATLDSSSCQST